MCCVTPRAPFPPRKGRSALAGSAGRSWGFVWSQADDRSFQADHPGSAASGRDGAGTEAAGNLRLVSPRALLSRESCPGGPWICITPHGLVVPTSIPWLKASSEYLGACAPGLSCHSPRTPIGVSCKAAEHPIPVSSTQDPLPVPPPPAKHIPTAPAPAPG